MPAVFIHGNPETAAIWDLLIPELDRDDVVRLSPPGFGAPSPEGWGGTRDDYLAWAVAEIEAIGEPVDLVGHDWGAGHTFGVALTRPDLLRSWALDCAGLAHPDYEWHAMAQGWQTPGVGEAIVAGMTDAPLEDRVAMFKDLGMTDAIAGSVAEHVDADMGRCILSLYRSAAQPALREMGADLSVMSERPGHVIFAENDSYVGTEAMSSDTAKRSGASMTVLSGVGHWWMIENPAAGATALNDFWAGL